MEHLTKMLGDVAVVEFVALAVLSLCQWCRGRTTGSGWAALSFVILAGVALAGEGMRLGLITPGQPLLKVLVAALLVVPFGFYRFAAGFDRPRRWIRYVAVVLTGLAVVATAALSYIPLPGMPSPPGFLAYRMFFAVQWGFLFTFVAVRMWRAGRRLGGVARQRMRLLAAAAAGLNVQIFLGMLGLKSFVAVAFGSQVFTVVMAVLFWFGLVPPAMLRLRWRRRHDDGLQAAIADLVRATSAQQVASGLLPHVAALVGAAGAALVDTEGRVVASYGDLPAETPLSGAARPEGLDASGDEASVQLRFGDGGRLIVWTSRYVPFFGRDELRVLAGLGDMMGLAIERCTLAEREREGEKALAQQALHDALTGLPNRTLFMDRLERALATVERHHSTVAVMFIDLDRFKVINDGMDHSAGDAVLIETARRLSGAMRTGDTVARFGGDEFVVLTEVLDPDEALAVANRLRRAIATPVVVGQLNLSVTASVGVVVTRRRADPSSLLRDADAAMYQAKDSGRNRVELFSEDLRLRAIERLELERTLQKAVGAGELRVVYQPIVRAADGAITGIEALVRWQHPQRGRVAPGEFIPIAEESELILAIDAWVLEDACRQLARWKETIPGLDDLVLWVNMSAGHFLRTGPARLVSGILAATGLEPRALGIEITETVFMANTDQLGVAFAEFKDLGVSIAIDDFGTGFSSLSYLKRFPIDVIKIDSSFVQGIGGEPETALVRACLALAQSLGLRTVAEGVETADHAAWLARSTCAHAQGYFYSRPLEPTDAEAILLARSFTAASAGAMSGPVGRVVGATAP